MIVATFALVIVVALGAGVWSRRGATTDIGDYLVGSRSFGGLLVFVLAVGEIYSIGTLIGFPGGVYAKGASYGVWFVGYILVAYPIGYWLAPYMWRAGKLYGAMTFPDAAGRHFRSPVLERVLAVSAVLFLIPWGQLQLTGLQVAMSALGINLNPTAAVFAGAALAFVFLLLSGVRAPAFVSFVKDTSLLLAALLIGLAAVGRSGGLTQLFASAKASDGVTSASHFTVTGSALTFALTTIVFQALGFYIFPFTAQSIFTAKSEATIKRTIRWMPVYMLMYPFLVVAAFAAITLLPNRLQGTASNGALLSLSRIVLPDWLTGIVAGGAALCAVVVLSGSALGIGSMVSRNIVPNIPETRQRTWVRLVIVVYLAVSLLLTVSAPQIMLTLINTAYYGLTQAAPIFATLIFGWRIRASALTAGLVVGEVLVLWLYVDAGPASTWLTEMGINIGLVALLVNTVIVVASRLVWPAGTPVRGLRSYSRREVAAATGHAVDPVAARSGATPEVRAEGEPA